MSEPVDIHRIIPLVRSRFYHEAMKLRVAGSAPREVDSFAGQQAYEVLGTHLAVSIAQDQPYHYRHLALHDIDDLGLTFDGALEIAKQNLANDRQRLPGGIRFDSVKEGFFFPADQVADHNASLVLYTDAFRRLPLMGDPVLFLPNTDIFWVAGSDQADVISLLCGMTLQEVEERPDRPITTIPFTLVGDRWQPWRPASTHPAFGDVEELYAAHEAIVYESQRNLLRLHHEATGQDLHVAKYQRVFGVTRQASQSVRSMAVWTETVPTLLPKTDVVQLQRLLNRESLDRGETEKPQFGEVIAVPWDSLRQLSVAAPQAQHLYPERYLAERFPTETAWRALREQSIDLPRGIEQGVDATGSPQLRTRPSTAKVAGIGCVLGCGGLVAVAFGFMALFSLVVDRRQPGAPPKFRMGDVDVLMPSHRLSAPSVQDFEAGVAAQQGVPVHMQGLRDLPPFDDLPQTSLVPSQVETTAIEEIGFTGHPRGETCRDRPPPGGFLVGLRLTKGREWGGAIRSLQPIYQVEDRYQLGQVCGPPQGVDQIQYLAKPGYAVGKLRVQVGLALNAVQVEFRSLDSGEDPPERYSTKWFGCPGGSPYEFSGGPFVGIDVAVAPEVVAVQLVRPAKTGNK